MRVRRILGVLGTLTFTVALVGALVGALLVVAPTAASAHPPGAHERDVLAEPAVVYIETSARADVVLHDGALFRATYDLPVLASGSGAVVNRNGIVITSSGVASPDLTRAKIYAVNQIFARHFRVWLPGDPFSRHRLTDPTLNAKLQGCYAPDSPTSDCVVFVTPRVLVFPFLVTSPPGIPAEVLRAGTGPRDAAILSVTGANMPTVALAPTLKGAQAVSTLGFAARPTAASTVVMTNPHLEPPGTSKLAAADLAALRKALPNAQGAVVVDAGSGAAVGVIGGAPGAAPSIVPTDAIWNGLRSLGIQPARSVVDTDFASAHSFFTGNHFSHAVPRLQEVLRLYPGHALAARELQIAVQKKGTAADLSLAEGESMPGHEMAPATPTAKRAGPSVNLVLLYVGLGLLLVALVLAFVFGRRVSTGRLRLPGLGVRGLRLRGRGERGQGEGGARGLSLRGLRMPGSGLRARLTHTGEGGELTESPPPPSAAGAAGDGGAAAPGTAPPVAPGNRPTPGRAEQADVTVQRPRVALPDGVPVPEQLPRDGARASAPPRPTPRATAAPGGAATATRAQFCTHCGMKMASEHRFCGYCGHEAGR